MVSGVESTRLLEQIKFGFWVRTKVAPFRAVRFQALRHPDGRESRRGRVWVEVLEHGVTREPGKFLTAEVELAGPHEWLDYYPAVNEPVCGWGRPRLPDGEMQYCPRHRKEDAAFCRRHMEELEGSEGEGIDDRERQEPEAGRQ